MPRGKYVNHKGRSRHFTSPEELANESSSEEETTEGEGGDDEAAAGTSKAARTKTTKPRTKKTSIGAGGGGESSDEDSDEESSEGEDRDAKKGVAALIEIENPNRATKKATQKLATLKMEDKAPTKPELTRREREQIEKQKARARYEKLHAAGKTTEAKSDLARLALVRQQRADAAAKREAEKKSMDEKKTSGKA